ncbi:MAG TPA: hypothetical protein VGM90_38160 [Kofleriaceae bacterium]|jgi:hypothetical protein
MGTCELTALLAVMASGCVDDRTLWRPDIEQSRVATFDILAQPTRALDILYVVDNSALMAPYEARLVRELDFAGDVIGQQSRWNDLHVGVVTSDVDCTGLDEESNAVAWRTDPAMVTGHFIVDWRHLDRSVTTNLAGGESLGHVVSRLGSAGHAGCGTSRPFEAVLRVLRDGTFHRDNADLMVGMLTAADEASRMDPEDFIAEVNRATRGRQVSVGAAGPHTALSEMRFGALAGRFSGWGSIDWIDRYLDGVVDGALSASDWIPQISDPCIETPLVDTDESADGLQANCDLRDEIHAHDGTVLSSRSLPACSGTNPPCWRIESDPRNCAPAPGHLLVSVDRLDFPPDGTRTVGQCEAI